MTLEDTVNKEAHGFRAFVADTTTAGIVTLARAVGRGIRDQALYGIQPDLLVRLPHAIIDTFTGRPYGKFRDYLLKKFDVTKESGFWKKAYADVIANGIANAVFYTPVYAATLYASGANEKQIATACGVSLVTSVLIGRPYGWLMDKVRDWFGVNQENNLSSTSQNQL